MSITATAVRIATSVATSAVFRAFGARLAFAVLHRLAAKTDNTLDDDLVQLAEDLYWGRRRPEWREEDE